MTAPQLFQGECLSVMATLPSASVDLILCDLPYGTTACSWDAVIPFDQLWAQYRRIIRPRGVVVLTAAQPFSTQVIASNLSEFRYCWYWDKKAVTGFANAKLQPLRCVEDVIVFYASKPTYNPQGLVRLGKTRSNSASVGGDTVRTDTVASAGKGSLRTAGAEYVQEWTNYPKQLLEISRDRSRVHPTQKPVALMEYLIRTYTNAGDTVLDNCMGSGTTGVAALQSGRRFIGIERDPNYFEIAKSRVLSALPARPEIRSPLPAELERLRRWNAVALDLRQRITARAEAVG
jgi:site-specific DNA-methyltransferase (adenine-specific)